MAAPQLTPALSSEALADLGADANVIAALPPGSRILSISPHGNSAWSWPFKMDTVTPDGQTTSFFIKVANTDRGRTMFAGEYESMKMLYTIAPAITIKPIAWGECTSNPDLCFFISTFHDMADEPPDAAEFCEAVANMHMKSREVFALLSQAPSPTKKFGFHVPTCLGKLPQDNRWCASWSDFYAQEINAILREEQVTQGPSEELQELGENLMRVVIPRLLDPLESDGCSIQPTLIHNDLQTKNVKVDKITGGILVFDAGCFWGHNECELGKWRLKRAGFNRVHMDEYHKHIPKTPPIEDWEDRIVLYTLRHNLFSSACRPNWTESRRLAMEDMQYLVKKYSWANCCYVGPSALITYP